MDTISWSIILLGMFGTIVILVYYEDEGKSK